MKKIYLYLIIIILSSELFPQISFGNSRRDESFFTEFKPSKSLNKNSSFTSPEGFNLAQNYPNPFNPSTVITYSLPEKSYVSLKIYNILGNEIATLVSEEKAAGTHNIKFDVSELPIELSNGTYFYMLKAGNYTETKKMTYIK